MKRIYNTMMLLAAVALSFGAMTSCSEDNVKEPEKPIEIPDDPEKPEEPEEPEDPATPVTVSYEVVASIGDDATRVALNDGESLKWLDTDKVTAWYRNAAGEATYALREDATVASIAEDGRATFNFANMPEGGYAWIAFGSNTGYDGCSAKKVEFNYNAAQTQAAAGAINPEYLRLASGRIDVVAPAEGEEVVKLETHFDIVGSIFRFLPYSATGKYADEQIQSVALVSVDNNIAGGGAAIARNYADYYDTEKGYKWHTTDANTFADEAVIFWDATSKSITTTLTTPLSLEGLESANEPGNGIYMCVPPVSVGGYKYVVTTDKAKYTFDASTTAVKFNDNELKNVLLNLENENVTRLDLTAVVGDLQYIGDLNAMTQKISCDGVTDKDGGYWYAQTRDFGADWVTREGADNAHFYTGVKFECIDNATGEAADWLTVSYRTDGNTHWFITAQPNTDTAERSATVTATFPDVDNYLVTEACRTKVVTVTQSGFSLTKTLGFYGGIGDSVIASGGVNKQSLGYCVITVNGTMAESWGNDANNEQLLYGSVVIECRDGGAAGPIVDWLTVEYGKDDNGKFNSTHLLATAPENTTGVERKALVCCTYNAPEGYEFEGGAKSFFRQFFVTQPANTGVSTVEFWGGLGAEFTHNTSAQQDWGLSYWVINVDGAQATDWAGDSHNEQLLYGSAEFKCYDYTNGVRGAEIDWVTVDYKRDAEGKVIDTWWLANIQENTGAARACEVVCTFPEHEGYVYKDGQNVKTTIIRQAGVVVDDPTIYDPTYEGNMWLSMNLEGIEYYYAPGWSQIANPTLEQNGNSYTFTLPAATYEQWQAQVKMHTNMSTSASKKYDLYLVMNSTQNHPGVTVKLYQTGVDGTYYVTDRHNLTANEDYVYKVSNMDGINIEKLTLLFDFGGNLDNTVITIKDILLQEHRE